MKNNFIILILIFSVKITFAQVPGYLGKRLSIRYKASLGSDWLLRSVVDGYAYDNGEYRKPILRQNALSHNKSRAINVRNEIGLEYALSFKSSIGIDFSVYKTGQDAPIYFLGDDYLDYERERAVRVNHNISGKNIVVSYRRYGTNIAPIGMYYGVNAGVNFITNEFIDSSGVLLKTIPAKQILVGVDLGHHLMLKDGLFLDLGLTCYLPVTNLEGGIVNSTGLESPITRQRNLFFNSLRFHIGIGYIIL